MKAIIAAAVLAISITGVAIAAPADRRVNVTVDPATAWCGGSKLSCPTRTLIFRYDDSAIHGDVKVWGCWGCRGEVAEGWPSWMRKVPTNYGYDLVGRPQPGIYRVKSYYDGVHHPSLDRIWRFIPR